MRNKGRQLSMRHQHIQIKGQNYIMIDKYMYTSSDYLGEGSFGKVYRGYTIPGTGKEMEVAIKTLELPEQFNRGAYTDREKMTVDSVRKEIVALKMLRHKNIVRLYDVKKLNNVIFMIMELCNEGSLAEFIKKGEKTELEIRYFFSQILDGFKYLRKKQITHRDVKPENILMRNGIMKIADFGFAKEHDSKMDMHSYLGTRATISPQVIMGQYTHKCDIWSLGATLYYMCFREYPFKGFYASEVKLMEIMKRDQIEFPKQGMQITPQLKQIIIQMMRFNETDRIEWEDLFQHPLFQQNLLMENGLNVFSLVHDDSEDEDFNGNAKQIEDLRRSKIQLEVDLEFEFNVMDKSLEELKQVEAIAVSHLDKFSIKQRCSKLQVQLINRITFEKGKANFLKQLSKKVHDYELSLSSKTIFDKTRVDIADHLKAVRFGLNKLELMMLRGMLSWMKTEDKVYYYYFEEKNPLGTTEDEWQMFLRESEKDRICRTLEKEISIEKQFVFSESWKTLNQIFKMNKATLTRFRIDENFLSDDLKCTDGFFVTLYNLCLGLAKLIFPEVVKISKNQDLIMRVASTLVLLDEIFILISLESTFTYDENNPTNFNKFSQDRRKTFQEDPKFYKTMLDRVLRTYEVFFE